MTNRWIAFLRAINTGNRRVRGDRLVAIFQTLGFDDVSSYQASGNVLFTADTPDVIGIEQALRVELGYEVPTVLRSAHAVQEIATTMPFDDSELEASQRRVQVILLRNAVEPETVKAVLLDSPPDDVLRGHDADVFWLPRAGISDSSLDLPAVERHLGPMTVRTLTTIQRLAARL